MEKTKRNVRRGCCQLQFGILMLISFESFPFWPVHNVNFTSWSFSFVKYIGIFVKHCGRKKRKRPFSSVDSNEYSDQQHRFAHFFRLIKHLTFVVCDVATPNKFNTCSMLSLWQLFVSWLFYFMSLAYKMTIDSMCNTDEMIIFLAAANENNHKIVKTRQSPTVSWNGILMKYQLFHNQKKTLLERNESFQIGWILCLFFFHARTWYHIFEKVSIRYWFYTLFHRLIISLVLLCDFGRLSYSRTNKLSTSTLDFPNACKNLRTYDNLNSILYENVRWNRIPQMVQTNHGTQFFSIAVVYLASNDRHQLSIGCDIAHTGHLFTLEIITLSVHNFFGQNQNIV